MRLIVALLFLASMPAPAEEKLFVLSLAELDLEAGVDEDVRQQCNIQEIVGKHVAEQIKVRYPTAVIIQDVKEAGQNRFLRVVIERNNQVPGLEIRRLLVSAEIVEKGKIVSSRDFRGATTGQTSERVGVCDVMGRLATAVGKKVAQWLVYLERKEKKAAEEKKGAD